MNDNPFPDPRNLHGPDPQEPHYFTESPSRQFWRIIDAGYTPSARVTAGNNQRQEFLADSGNILAAEAEREFLAAPAILLTWQNYRCAFCGQREHPCRTLVIDWRTDLCCDACLATCNWNGWTFDAGNRTYRKDMAAPMPASWQQGEKGTVPEAGGWWQNPYPWHGKEAEEE